MAPEIGPVLGIGLLSRALLAAIGALTGGAIENYMAQGLPGDELLIYEDALRRDRSVGVAVEASLALPPAEPLPGSTSITTAGQNLDQRCM